MILHRKKKLLIWTISLSSFLIGLAFIPGSICRSVVKNEWVYSGSHMVAHLVLAIIFCLYLKFRRRIGTLPMTDFSICVIASFASVLFGAGIEGIQAFVPGRYPDWLDFYWNVAGTASGILFFLVFRNSFRFVATSIKERRLDFYS